MPEIYTYKSTHTYYTGETCRESSLSKTVTTVEGKVKAWTQFSWLQIQCFSHFIHETYIWKPTSKDLLSNTGTEKQMTDAKNKDENYLTPLPHK